MKPRTKKEIEVSEIRRGLKPLTERQVEWAKTVYTPKIVVNKTSSWCQCCGAVWPTKGNVHKQTLCPECGRRFYTQRENRRSDEVRYYVAYLDTLKEYQVIREYEVKVKMMRHQPLKITLFEEVQQMFMKEDLKYVGYRLNYSIYGGWEYNKGLSLKRDIHPLAAVVAPWYKVLPIFRRNGYTNKIKMSPLSAMQYLIIDPKFETIVKAKMYGLLPICWTGRSFASDKWSAMKICIRNKYKAYDWSIWWDYIGMIADEGKDLRNAKYVCPPDLKKAHDATIKRVRLRRAKADKEFKHQQMLKLESDRKQYAEKVMPYKDMTITDGKIYIRVLPDLESIKAEGDAMNHCIFDGKYYTKPNSLLLTARDRQGYRIETIEYDLKHNIILQSRGVNNSYTELHDDIVGLVENNIYMIKKMSL